MIHESSGSSELQGLDPLVSIVIINHNYSKYVCKAIESALGQSYQNIHVSVIDDGSTDNSVQIIRNRFQEKIQLIEQDNSGIVYSRNKAIDIAEGKYIVQLDADDYLDEDYVKKCVALAESMKCDIVYTQLRYFGNVNFVSMFPDFDLEALKHENYIACCALFSLDFIRESKILYDEYLSKLGYEDWDFALHLCLEGASAKLLDEPLYNYRKHKNDLSRNDAQESNLFNLLLVRHHIWQKMNDKFSDEFSTFGSEIDLLYRTICFMEDNNDRLSDLMSTIDNLYSSKEMKIGSSVMKKIRAVRSFVKKVL